MPLMPGDELEWFKKNVELLKMVQADGFHPVKHGSKDWKIRCPFHDDKTASLIITPKTGKPDLWHCFGCDTGGTVVDWVQQYHKVGFKHAMEIIKAFMGSGKTELPKLLSDDMDSRKIFLTVLDYYHDRLVNDPNNQAALDYLSKRGLQDENLINTFKVGYADRSLGLRLPGAILKAGASIRSKLIETGLYRGTGREHFYGCVVFPLVDFITNEPVCLYGRRIGTSKQGIRHLYPTGPRKGVLNPAGIREAATHPQGLILCESVIDALTFWVNGFTNVTCAYGTGGLNGDLLDAIKMVQIDQVRIAFDRDEQGDQSALKLSDRLNEMGIATHRIEFPHQSDANGCAVKSSHAKDELASLIRSASFVKGKQPPPPPPEASPEVVPEPSEVEAIEVDEAALPATLPGDLPGSLPGVVANVELPPDESKGLEIADDLSEVVLTSGELKYRVRGLEKNGSYEKLKVQIKVTPTSGGGNGSPNQDAFHLDTVDLCQATRRQSFIKMTSVELCVQEAVIKKDVARLFGELEALRDRRIDEKRRVLETAAQDPALTMPPEEKEAGLALLKDPKLLDRIKDDFRGCGIVGETTNSLIGYLAATSRLLDKPLAIVVQSSSSAGKSALMDAILAFMPPEAVSKYSAMTGQSLYYFGEETLTHKILAIAEEQGAEQASYSLKLFQSEGELTIAAPSKDSDGKMQTQVYEVKGPAAIFFTTTAIDIDEELLNRCLVLTVNEQREQTQRIHEAQRTAETLEGLKVKQSKALILSRHHSAQRLLEVIDVVNPYAKQLTFLDHKTRARRDHPKYLTLIKTITLLHQHQRPRKELVHPSTGEVRQYIEVTPDDIEVANDLMAEVLGYSLDELPPQARNLLEIIHENVKEAAEKQGIEANKVIFTRKELRGWCGWSDPQVRRHLEKLMNLEYVYMHRDMHGKWVYELLYEGDETDCGNKKKFLTWLIDPRKLIPPETPETPEHDAA